MSTATATVTGPVYHVWINLADHEWGNELMREVADAYFASHPTLDPLVVEVHEHAGWFLQFARCGTVVGTANDGCRFPERAKAIIGSLRNRHVHYLPSIRR
jgi:hypothetical protein